MLKNETIPRDASLEGEALTNHLRAVASEYRKTGHAGLSGIRRSMRMLDISLAILRARHDSEELTPAAIWLVDNARMLEEACVTLREEIRHTPRLPARRGKPRIVRLVREWLSHTDGKADGESLMRVACAWQAVDPLTESELSLLPLAARRALLLLLSELAVSSAEAERERTHAEATLDIEAKNRPDSYWERLSYLLQERENAQALSRLDARLAELGTSASEVAEREHDRQTRACLWTGNAIASLRALSSLEWRTQMESLSSIDCQLRQDPTGIYPRMDFASRTMYRMRAAKLARRFGVAESVVAKSALACAQQADNGAIEALSRHVGYYLMDEGQPALWDALGNPPFSLRMARFWGKRAAITYILSIFLGSTLVTVLLWLLGIRGWLVALALLVAGEGFRQLAGLLIHRLSPPRRMARLAPDKLEEGNILVVVPTLLTNRNQALEMVRHLSVLRLANPESKLAYMLLGDYRDGPAMVEPDDAEITDAALSATHALNDVWNGGFYYLHRSRAWNEKAGRFMGRERKRGALEALNALLLTGSSEDSFVATSCELKSLKGQFEIVITLDADTQLPPGTALELAGMIQHPLNFPCQNNGKRRGCAVIQPRMETAASTVHTHIARVWGGDGGFDPYITAFSDIYQNLCGEGSFAGKGVYHVRAFQEAIEGKILGNSILSHDLLEGAIVGSSLACDVALYDSQPASLSSWMKRLHRWTRGDWQLLPWLLPFVRGEHGWIRNPMSMLNQFKVYDNLRRSLVPLAALALLIGGVRERSVAAVLSGLLLPNIRCLMPVSKKSMLAALTHFALLPYEAMCLLDAAGRTLWRVLISRRHLLEWTPSAEAERQRGGKSSWIFWPNYLAVGLLLLASVFAPIWLLLSIPVACLWAIAPITGKWLDSEEKTGEAVTDEQKKMLLDIAERTFRFFCKTVTPETHYLPPDNLQLEPPRDIAPRTSPTNIGMYLLACVSACELGMLDADSMARKIEKTIDTLERLEKWHGHPYNWYDVHTLAPLPPRYVSSVDDGNLVGCLLLTAQALRSHLSEVDANLLTLPARVDALAAMDFSRLYDPKRDLFYVGIDIESGLPGESHYDLMASEARLLSYIALMRREAPVKHWRRLGRSMTKTRRGEALLSWGGTIFEYLLPALFLTSPHGTLLGHTCHHAALEQVSAFAGSPWGVSESGYYAFDPALAYQYRAFGLPRLALRTSRAEQVIAPYASVLALGFLPREAFANIRRMADMGWLGELGFYEAADYNRERIPEGCEYKLIKSHMAHHQGMILASICNLLTGNTLTKYFHSLPQAEAYALLLEEKRPTAAMLRGAARTRQPDLLRKRAEGSLLRHASREHFPTEVQVLYGGGTTMVCDARGHGYISHNGVFLTRQRLDPFYEGGPQIYLKHMDGSVQCVTQTDELWFDRSRATYRVSRNHLEVELIGFVSPIDGAAIHLLRLHAMPEQDAYVEVASFLEVCLSTQVADESHPAFRNLSVETERTGPASIIARRRTKSASERFPVLLHAVGAEIEFEAMAETSRYAFLGRGENLRAPEGLRHPLKTGEGLTRSPIDPCLSLRMALHIEAGTTLACWFITAAADDVGKTHALTERYADKDYVLRALELSLTQDEVTAKYLSLDTNTQLCAQRMASWLLAPLAQPARAKEKRSALWQFAISGDLPVIVVVLTRDQHMPLARAALKAHAYLRALGLWSDMVFINEQPSGYHRPIHDAMLSLINSSASRDLLDKSAGVRLIDRSAHASESIEALLAHAAIVLRGGDGSLATQLGDMRRALSPAADRSMAPAFSPPSRPAKSGSLGLDNGFGGFRADGGYVIHDMPPSPWCNILANPAFGAVVTDRGAGFIWQGNSRMRRLTAFASDIVRDQRSENLWVRDEDSGVFISPYDNALVTHGFGFSRFESEAMGLAFMLDVFVDDELPVKCMLLEITNAGAGARTLSVTAYVRWLLGSLLQDAAQVHCEASGGAVYAYSPIFQRPAYLLFPGRRAKASCDGAAFIGIDGNADTPRGMQKANLENGRSDVPCGIIRTHFTLERGNRETVCVLIGAGEDQAAYRTYQNGGAQLRLARVRALWQTRQEGLMPRIPDVAAGLMLGCWLPYQALSSRIYAHAGFFQAGGAIGFRDQLQDMLAFRFTEPEMVRRHLLEAAAHQFEAGDVQHWWHPPAQGVRTKITDDRLFMPYVTALYIAATEDFSILREEAPYLKNVEIPARAEDWYGDAQTSDRRETLHQHNLRAIRSIAYGEHGIPLMGAGDWNDGMSAVGIHGRGESVWLGFFLAYVLKAYAEYCDQEEADELLSRRTLLMHQLETHAWDGDWYLRAWFDDGTPLGSKENGECRIDLVVQAWAVLAGAKRAAHAFESALDELLDKEAGILKLLSPPFDGALDPGYIRAYPAGVRENGGQYTHAAVWFVMACAKLGKTALAWELFDMLLPTSHSRDMAAALRYRVEPYVVAADISGYEHAGRGGWTWYTGSASLLWSLGVETLLGFEKRGNRVRLSPTAPKEWEGYAVEYRFGRSLYILRAQRTQEDAGWVELVDDGETHEMIYSLKS